MSDFAIEQVRKWIDGGGDSWGLPMQSIEKVLAGYIEARAQIAAKDAALREIATECSTFPIKEGLAFRCESIALNGLATPAQETE